MGAREDRVSRVLAARGNRSHGLPTPLFPGLNQRDQSTQTPKPTAERTQRMFLNDPGEGGWIREEY